MTNKLLRTVTTAALGGASLGALTLSLAFGLALPATVAQAQEPAAATAATTRFDIPAQDAAGALEAFGRQSGKAIMYDRDRLGTRQLRGVQGDYAPDAALRMLTEGSGLTVRMANANTFVVEAPGESYTGGNGGGAEALAQGQRGISEILVVGSKSQNVDIRRTEDDPQPYVVIGAEALKRSPGASVEEFLKSELPMNSATLSNEQTGGPNLFSGTVDLRGLGSNQTLILVDGRRQPGMAGISGTFNQPIISGIPLAAVERIEILPTSASAIYGGGATGGVVNIILKHDYTGVDIGARYGNSTRGDVGEHEIHANGGFHFGGTSVNFAASHSGGDPLYLSDREFTERSRKLALANVPSSILNATFPLNGATTNICGAVAFSPTIGICRNGPALTLRGSGTPLGSTVTSLPAGYSGPGTDGGLGLRNNAGSYNLAYPDVGEHLLREPTKTYLSLNLRQEFTNWLEAWAASSYSRLKTTSNQTGFTNIFVPASVPTNPFNENVVVTLAHPSLVRPSHNDMKTVNLSGGLLVRLPHHWTLGLDKNWARTKSSFTSRTLSPLTAAQAATLVSSGALFRDLSNDPLPVGALDTSPNFIGYPQVSILDTTSARLSGPLLDLPGGSLVLTGLAERRTEKTKAAFATSGSTVNYYPPRHRNAHSVYLEARAPLVSARNAMPLVKELEFQASVRHDDYKTKSTSTALTIPSLTSPLPSPAYYENILKSTDYLLAFKYTPFTGISLRGSYGTGFVPPELNQLIPSPPQVSPVAVGSDPRRGGTPIPAGYTTLSGGNPGLLPETSVSKSLGLIFKPSFIEGARFSVDYTHIRKKNESNLPGLQYFLNNESLYSDRVVRAASNLPGDLPGWAPPVIQIDVSRVNLFQSSYKAFDFQFDYVKPVTGFGTLTLAATATLYHQFEKQVSASAAALDYVGFSSGPLQWKGNAQLGWQEGRWGVTWSTQYYDSYLITSPDNSSAGNTQLITLQGASTIRKQLYHDLFVSYEIPKEGSRLLSGIRMSLTIKNIFDTSPPIIAQGISGGPYSSYGDPRLRRFFFTIDKSF